MATHILKTNTATRITVGPFLDKTDGVTPETALTVTSCKLTMTVDTAGVPTLVLDTNPTASGGANDMVHITGDDAGLYDLELAAANLNYLGNAKVVITDAATHCPVVEYIHIVPANVWDSLMGGTDTLQADVTQLLGTAWLTPGTAGTPDVNTKLISGDATAADNLETLLDDTAGAVPWIGIVDQGTAQSATGTTLVLRSAFAAADDALNGMTLLVYGSTQGYWQARQITDYVTATDTATVDTWTTTPSGTITYKIIGSAPGSTSVPVPANVTQWLSTAVATPTVAGIPEVDLTHIGGTAATSAAGIPEVKVASMAANVMTAAAAAADLTTEIAAGVLTVAMTESYATDGAAPTLAQAIFAIQQFLQEKSVSSTTMTVKKLDGSTTAMTFTLNDATTPTSITRAS